ncbi:MAG: M20 family metallo-hydrolase [candidate division NC10 bacterium]|nr:M20 family metallo-hydrolase [candidate division NC10 bacterium]
MDKAWVVATLDGIARFGKGERGFSRLVFGEAEWGAVEYVTGLMREADLAVRTDAFGNVIGRLEGRESGASVVATGSHVDTVPEGGNFDGVVGVLAGLGALMRLKARGLLRHPVEVMVFRGEESARFSIHTMGSKVMAGIASVEAWRKLQDHGGTTLAQALAARGLDLERIPEAVRRPEEFKAFVEMHIEQGPVLEEAGIPIGVVEAIAGPVRLKISVEGTASHSGTTPMGKRRDALVSAAQVVLAVQDEAAKRAERRIVGTVGVMKVHPGAMNVVPGRVEMWVDIRGIDAEDVAATARAVREAAARIADREGTRIRLETLSSDAPVPMDSDVIRTIEAACRQVGVAYRRMPSGAGHDAMNMAKLAPAGMIFIPCRQGASHNPDEYAAPEDILTGIDVLTETLAALAG